MGFNFVGDGIRDWLDPHARQVSQGSRVTVLRPAAVAVWEGMVFVNPDASQEQIDGISARTDLPMGFGISAFGRDITDLKNLEERFYESEKMAAVGQMAAGIAARRARASASSATSAAR